MNIAVVIVAAAAVVVALAFVMYRLIQLRFLAAFEAWKGEYAAGISREAIKGSQAAITGRVLEKFAPYLPEFAFNPRDARFLGDPVDFVVFDGLSEGAVRRVVFLEVKSGGGALNGNERKVRTAVAERRVEWQVFRVAAAQPGSDPES